MDIFLNVRFDLQILPFPHVLKGQQAFAQLLAQVVNFRFRENLLVFQLIQLQNLAYSMRFSSSSPGSCSMVP